MFNINSTKSVFFGALLITSFTFEIVAQEIEEVVVTATKKRGINSGHCGFYYRSYSRST
jgi:hypothetical protein